MEAERERTIPDGNFQFEPKWDGFRAIIFKNGNEIYIQSKNGQPLARYFPEIVDAFHEVKSKDFVVDGEIVIPVNGQLSFDDLLLRIHPAESRVQKLAAATPAHFFAFDLLAWKNKSFIKQPIEKRRAQLEKLFTLISDDSLIQLSPASTDRAIAQRWFKTAGLEGVMAKKLGEPYHSGDRHGMVKVKHFKTADCVVGGFRYGEGTKTVGSLLLGLYDDEERLVHVGHTSSIKKADRKELTQKLESLRGKNAFEVRVPGGPSRWAVRDTSEWEPVKPKLVCEVEYDYFSQGRFRHGSKFLRWRPDKSPKQCTMDQVLPKGAKKSAVLAS